MKTSHIAAFILSGIFALPAVAQMKVLEHGFEIAPSKVRLPADETGELTLQRCLSCPVLRLRASARSRYIIGDQEVGLTVFKRYVEQTPPNLFVVMQLNHTNQLSRIVVSAVR